MPRIRPLPNHRSDPTAGVPNEPPFRASRLTGSLSLSSRATPRAIENIASVAMNGTTRPYATAVALIVLSAVANAIAPRMKRMLLVPLSPMRMPPKTPAAATIEPVEVDRVRHRHVHGLGGAVAE